MSEGPIIDYAYEDEKWMLLYEQLKEDTASAAANDDDGSQQEKEDEAIANLESMIVAVRLGRLANLQCAALESRTSAAVNQSCVEQLLLRTRREFDAEPHQPLVDLLVKASSESASPSDPKQSHVVDLDQEELCTSLDIDAFFEEYPECIRSDWGRDDDDDDDDDDDSEQDDCHSIPSSLPSKAAAPKVQRLDHSFSSGAETNPTSKPTESIKSHPRPLADQAPRDKSHIIDIHDVRPPIENPYTSKKKMVPDHTGNHSTSQQQPLQQQHLTVNHSIPPEHSFSYAPMDSTQHPSFVHHSNGGNLNNISTSHSTTNGLAAASTYPRNLPPPDASLHNRSAWVNHCNQQNPFHTAREMAEAEQYSNNQENYSNKSQSHPTQDYVDSQPQRTLRQWGQQPAPPHNPYGYQMDNGRQESSIPTTGPHIPESLKRKFQPPKKANHDNNNNNNNNNFNPNNERSTMTATQNGPAGKPFGPTKGGGIHARPQSYPRSNSGGMPRNNGGGTSNTSNSNSGKHSNPTSGDDDNEELPEELQHLDKELVLKIQNEIMESGESVNFEDIAGLHDAKQTVLEVVVWPMLRPDVFTGLRRAPNGLLLFGPPGTGKTLIGKAIANETKATFFSISSSSLTSKWIGEGEKLVKTLFAVAAYREPAVVFIDEIDSLLTQRKAEENEASRRIKTEFLVQLDGAGTANQGRVLVIGATNRPQELDEAARRRFTKRMYIPLPNEDDRRILLQVMLKNNKHVLTDSQIEILAKDTNGFSGADLKALCTDAAMGPIRQLGAKAMEVDINDIPPIAFKHFKKSLKGTRPSVAASDVTQYVDWDRIYGSSRAEQGGDDDDDDDDDDDIE